MELIGNIRRWFLRRQHKKQLLLVAESKLRKQIETMLFLIDDRSFKKYSSKQTIGLTLISAFPNLGSLSQFTREVNRPLRNKKAVDRLPRKDPIIRDLDLFLTLENGYYVKVSAGIKDYLSVVGEFCDNLKDSDTADYGIDNHNLRMCTHLLEEHHRIVTLLLEIYVRSFGI